jgi:VanZ family protein
VKSPTPPNLRADAGRLASPDASPPRPADAVEPALPGTSRRPLQGEKELHEAQRSEDDRGVPTASWPLSLAMVCLVIYASLYPFTDWRNQGISPLAFIDAPWPKYWTGFDVVVNVAGYAPLGFLLALAALRSRRIRLAVVVAVGVCCLLSLSMETLQSYLPLRVPSKLDWALNTAGGLAGACAAKLLQHWGVIDRWSRFRARWLTPDARGAVALVVLWPVALLFPASVSLGLGQVFERLEIALAEILTNTPFLSWLPVRDIELQPLTPSAELACVALGVLAPCLLGFGVLRTAAQRVVFGIGLLAVGVAVSALSAALSYGPQHAWAWLDATARSGLILGIAAGTLLLWVPPRLAAGLTVLALAAQLVLLNQAPTSAYFSQTLQTWEQGRFIRFNGLVQWLGWVWPYAAMLYAWSRLVAPRQSRLPPS